MSTTPITDPLQDEHVVGLSPVPGARVDGWNRRLNLFTGRALSDTALTAEQAGRSGRLALRGQLFSPGVVQGLEVGLETREGAQRVHVASGYGVCVTGEDVFVPAAASAALSAIRVHVPARLLDDHGAAELPTGALEPRRLGPALGMASALGIPRAGILLLQPAERETLASFDPTGTCEEDPQGDPYADEQIVDAARLVYYAWPTEWLPLPEEGERWRNRLAWAIFEREAALAANEAMPWEVAGVPIALIGLNADWNALFVDRHAVVRRGGRPRRRTALMPGWGHEHLWQARIEQLAGHLADLDPSLPGADLAKEVRYLPPAGILPRSALKLQAGAGATRVAGAPFFPGTYTVDAIPAPLEQLDLLARTSASLAAFDTFVPDEVTVVVPVPQGWYEPELLKVLRIDGAFQTAVDRFARDRALWLERRGLVRQRYATLVQAAKGGTPPVFPSPDPDALETTEPQAPSEIDVPAGPQFAVGEERYGTSFAQGSETRLLADAMVDVAVKLAVLPGVKNELAQLPNVGLEAFAALLDKKADAADHHIDLGFLRVQTDIYRTRQKMLGSEAAVRLAVSPALAEIAQGGSAVATSADLEKFLAKVKPVTAAQPKAAATDPQPSNALTVVPHFALTAHVVAEKPSAAVTKAAKVFALAPTAFFAGTSVVDQVRKVAEQAGPMLTAAVLPPSMVDVTQQRSIVGADYNLRNLSVVERLKDPDSAQVLDATVANKAGILASFLSASLDERIDIDDLDVPGFLMTTKGGQIETTRKFGAVTASTVGEILAGRHDIVPTAADVSRIFASGVRAMENVAVFLRRVEARVQLYRQAAAMCREALASVTALIASAAVRLQTIGNELSRTRHDLAVARALLAEEQARIDAVNFRRDRIVSEQVRFVAYFRPRTIEARRDLPSRPLDPGVTAPTVPACLARAVAAPPELRAFVNLLREAPLRWFRHVPDVMSRLDRLDVLQDLIGNARLRAGFRLTQLPPSQIQSTSGPLAAPVSRVFSAQQQVMLATRAATAQLDAGAVAAASWTEARERARQLVSLGDLVDLGHYDPEVPRVSAAEIENILRVSASLYSDLSEVLPALRLLWAERLIEVEGAVNLADLANLPRWGDVPVLERKEMQALVDWLFSRIDPREPEAVAHVNDLLRICVLLASHAPVADIVAGDVIRSTVVNVGARIDVAVDLSRVRLGMHVLFYQGTAAVARAVVEDIGSARATARVLLAPPGGVTLAQGTKAHIADADAFDRNPLTAGT